jgi:hypothetical protein
MTYPDIAEVAVAILDTFEMGQPRMSYFSYRPNLAICVPLDYVQSLRKGFGSGDLE